MVCELSHSQGWRHCALRTVLMSFQLRSLSSGACNTSSTARHTQWHSALARGVGVERASRLAPYTSHYLQYCCSVRAFNEEQFLLTLWSCMWLVWTQAPVYC
jgi:hypothetical protein